MENLEELLRKSTELMKTAKELRRKNGGTDLVYIEFIAIQAVYLQNQIIIELLKNYQR